MEDSLSKKQFGFKKGTSTETSLHKVIYKIEKTIAKKGYVLGTFLDIEGAFDNVSFKAISEAIDQSPLESATAGWIKNMVTFNNQQITFWSDSPSALQALSNKIHNNKSINDCHTALAKLADENTVQLKWIKFHTGHWGNEKADELAKAGTVSSNLMCSLVPLNHIKNMINDKVNSLTHKRWNSNRHAHTDLILGNHHTKTLKILINNLNNRTRYRTGICIITGHIGLNKHLHS